MFYKIGHRGAAGHLPENTLPSFKKALELDVNMIELDVRICKSKEIVVIHDRSIKRISHTKGVIKHKNYQDLKNLHIPTLKDVFDLINKKAKINIELKGSGTAEPVARLIKHYIENKGWKDNDFLISSFKKDELKKFFKILPQVRNGVLISNKTPFSFFIKKFPILFKNHLNFAKKINSFSINIHKSLVNEQIVKMAHQENFKLFTFTVNSKKEINYFKNIGVDGIFSDYPDKI